MASTVAYQTLNRAAVVLDRFRTQLLSWSSRQRPLRAFVVDKETRIAGVSIGHACMALLGALLCPSLLLVLGPLLFGVPHVASDIRYLVLRRSGPRGFGGLALGFSVALVGLRLLEIGDLGNEVFAHAEVILVFAWVSSAFAFSAVASRKVAWRCSAFFGGLLSLAFIAFSNPTLARVVFAHAHNAIGVVVWYVLFRRGTWRGLLPLGFIALASAGLYLAGGQVPERFGWPEWFDLHVRTASTWLAPGLPLAQQRGLVLVYAFLQSVHYAIWLMVVPQEVRRQNGSPTFAMSLKSAWLDFGPKGLLLIAALSAVVLTAALVDALTTSSVYLFVTPFHGYLELVVLALWLAAPSRTVSVANAAGFRGRRSGAEELLQPAHH